MVLIFLSDGLLGIASLPGVKMSRLLTTLFHSDSWRSVHFSKDGQMSSYSRISNLVGLSQSSFALSFALLPGVENGFGR